MCQVDTNWTCVEDTHLLFWVNNNDCGRWSFDGDVWEGGDLRGVAWQSKVAKMRLTRLTSALPRVSTLEPLDMSFLREYRFDEVAQCEAKKVSTTLSLDHQGSRSLWIQTLLFPPAGSG